MFETLNKEFFQQPKVIASSLVGILIIIGDVTDIYTRWEFHPPTTAENKLTHVQ